MSGEFPKQLTVDGGVILTLDGTTVTGGSITDTDLLNRFRRFAGSLAWSAARLADFDGQMTARNQTTGGFYETFNASLTFFGDPREPAGHARSIDRH